MRRPASQPLLECVADYSCVLWLRDFRLAAAAAVATTTNWRHATGKPRKGIRRIPLAESCFVARKVGRRWWRRRVVRYLVMRSGANALEANTLSPDKEGLEEANNGV